jgi:hypothetical protein
MTKLLGLPREKENEIGSDGRLEIGRTKNLPKGDSMRFKTRPGLTT